MRAVLGYVWRGCVLGLQCAVLLALWMGVVAALLGVLLGQLLRYMRAELIACEQPPAGH